MPWDHPCGFKSVGSTCVPSSSILARHAAEDKCVGAFQTPSPAPFRNRARFQKVGCLGTIPGGLSLLGVCACDSFPTQQQSVGVGGCGGVGAADPPGKNTLQQRSGVGGCGGLGAAGSPGRKRNQQMRSGVGGCGGLGGCTPPWKKRERVCACVCVCVCVF
jgi:hypothetical protein